MPELVDVEVLTEGLEFPEGPVAMGDGSVIVTEMRVGRLTRVWPDGTQTIVAETGGGPNGAAQGPDGAIYVCNNSGMPGRTVGKAAIQRVDLATGRCDTLYDRGDGIELGRPNDLVFDAAGNFYFTDIEEGTVHYASPDGSSIKLVWEGVHAPNGVGLSPDGSTLYIALTLPRQLLRRAVVGPGELAPSPNYDLRSFVRTGQLNAAALVAGLPGNQELDSLAVDSTGAICVATLIESGITVFSPDGSHIVKHTLPEWLSDPVVTNICFGGADLCTAYITLTWTGRLISCRWPQPGLALHFQDLA